MNVSARWREVEVDESRFGALQMWDADLGVVSFTGVRVDFDLRGAQLVDVFFDRCHLPALDLADSTCSRLAFRDCTVTELTVQGAITVE